MPFLIWGSRGLTSNIDDGNFYCPQCDRDGARYRLKGSRTWFTMYFIPIFPISGTTRYVECQRCQGTFREEVLDLKPLTEAERMAGAIADSMQRGQSLREASDQLKQMGMTPDNADEFVRTLAGEKVWACIKCGEEYVGTVKKCRACESHS